jgi:hypothetical protein
MTTGSGGYPEAGAKAPRRGARLGVPRSVADYGPESVVPHDARVGWAGIGSVIPLVRSSTRLVAAAALLSAVLLAVAPGAAPAADPVIADEEPYAIEKQDDGTWTASFGLTNATDAEITLTATATDDSSCKLSPAPAKLAANARTEVKLTAAASCEVPEEGGLNFELAGIPGVESLALTASPPTDDDPDWAVLDYFLLGFFLALFAVLYAWFVWTGHLGDGKGHSFTRPLPKLDPTWSFKESWVANITVAATVVTLFLGSSEVIKSLLGDDAEAELAVLIVSAALSASLVAAGQVALLAAKSEGQVTVFGLLLGALLVLMGSFGELLVLMDVGQDLDIGGQEDTVVAAAVLAIILLLVYAVRTLIATLRQGAAPDAGVAVSEARLLAAATLLGEARVNLRNAPEKLRDLEEGLAAEAAEAAEDAAREAERAAKAAAKKAAAKKPAAKKPAARRRRRGARPGITDGAAARAAEAPAWPAEAQGMRSSAML